MAEFLALGHDYLADHPNFRLVGRRNELMRLAAILMRSRANSVLLAGPGGVGCTALCLGLQAMKKEPDAPFDIVSKRFFWLDTDGLFSSGDGAAIGAAFQKIMNDLYRTPDSVLVIEDAKDFIEAARNNGSMHFINALTLAVDKGKTQIILESRDDDLDVVLKCHSDIRECFTMLDVEEPGADALREILADAAAALSRSHGGITITPDAVATAIEVTSKYRTRDMGLSRAQPERSITLLDRAMASYKLEAHRQSPELAAIDWKLRHFPPDGQEFEDPDVKALRQERDDAEERWAKVQDTIRSSYRVMREAEVEVLAIEEQIEQTLAAEAAAKAERAANGQGEVQRKITSFMTVAAEGGFESDEVRALRGRLAQVREVVSDERKRFDDVTAEINAKLCLDRAKVLQEFSRISGIAVDKLNEDERAKLARLEQGLKARIFGQDAVVEQVASAVRVAKVGRRNKGQPLPFLFMGPSGVGKTELAKALAANILDDEAALTRFDMSEYMEKHAVAKLIGAPPGYEGFEVGGILTNAMRKNPNRILLFDEIEKAHPDVFNIFLQILGDGRLTDNIGRPVFFADAIVVMTTNIGQTHFLDAGADPVEARGAAMAELDAIYRSEFLNRFNGRQNIFCFDRLDLPAVERIVRREIKQIDEAYRGQGISIEMNDAEIEAFCRSQYDPKIGARGLPGYIKANLERVVVDMLLTPDVGGILCFGWDAETRKFSHALTTAAAI